MIESIEIKDVRDNKGVSVFLTSDVATPAELLFAVPDDLFQLLSVANYISGLELIPVPRNASYSSNPGETAVSSQYLRNLIRTYAQEIPDANTSSTVNDNNNSNTNTN